MLLQAPIVVILWLFGLLNVATLSVAFAPRGGRCLHLQRVSVSASPPTGSMPPMPRMTSMEGMDMDLPEWSSIGNTQVLYPREKVPLGVIHFIGGFVAGSLVTVTYSPLLEYLATRGYLIVASPLPLVDLDHSKLAAALRRDFEEAYMETIRPEFGAMGAFVPVIGMGHSLGGKLMLLGNTGGDGVGGDDEEPEPRLRYFGNVFLSFNNYSLRESFALGREQATEAAAGAGMGAVEDILRPIVNAIYCLADSLAGLEGNKKGMAGVAALGDFGGVGGRGRGGGGGGGGKPEMADVVTGGLGSASGLAAALGSVNVNMGNAAVDETANTFKENVRNMSNIGKRGTLDDIQDMVRGFVEGVLQRELGAREFSPSPDETWQRVAKYRVSRNVVVQFDADEIDQSVDLAMRLRNCGVAVDFMRCTGTHLTPNMFDASVDRSFLPQLGQVLDRLSFECDVFSQEQYSLPSSVELQGSREESWETDDH